MNRFDIIIINAFFLVVIFFLWWIDDELGIWVLGLFIMNKIWDYYTNKPIKRDKNGA